MMRGRWIIGLLPFALATGESSSVVFAPPAPPAPPVAFAARAPFREPGDSIIEAMFARWNGHTYRTATFVQNTRFPDGRRQTWYESFRAPGWLRIDLPPLDSARTILFREDSLYTGQGGRWSDPRPYVRVVQLLFTDVFWAPTNATTRTLRALGYDLSVSHVESWQGRPAVVVGARAGDTLSAQFWVDKERLIVVRLIELERRPGAGTLETRVVTHAKAGTKADAGWIESEVVYLEGGREIRRDVNSEIRVDIPLDNTVFTPSGRTRPDWLRGRS